MPTPVTARLEPLTLPTYPVGEPERHPLFFEKRVYQGSCGKVYPVPFIDKVFDTPKPVAYTAAHLENEYIRLVILPEVGGRVLIGQDKANGDYDFLYRQDVIKPALVGLAGPWVSGGIEFNWPQHHRPSTFMPADVFIEEEADGARTIWLSEHDPMFRLKGMHGLRLRPGSALIEIRVRLFNRSPFQQTFLWWTNIAARVHDYYQSFFPLDVDYVADHAVRAQSTFPIAHNPYYGIDYASRPGANDLTWYKNIPVPTSYMVCDSKFDFFGGYDHEAGGGFVHVANHHISPGKKQWTWGNHAFGHAWDRELTDTGGPYIELMAGVYTDNQPDFSYLAPYETRAFSQFLWPLQSTGPLHLANERAGLRLAVGDDHIEIAAAAPAPLPRARIVLREGDRVILETPVDLGPGKSFRESIARSRVKDRDALTLELFDHSDRRILIHSTRMARRDRPRRPVATEPPAPDETRSTDELFLIGEHLEKYRHPTRDPEPWWEEALKRDPGDARCRLALGKRQLRRGEFDHAATHLEAAIARLAERSRNPVTCEAHYYLGLVRRFQEIDEEAYALFYKATWDYAWRAPAFYGLALIDCTRGDFEQALIHLDASLDTNRQNNKAHVLKAAVLRRLGRHDQSEKVLDALLSLDPLDHWARHEKALLTNDFSEFIARTRNDAQTILDLVFDYADAGFKDEALALLDRHHANSVPPAAVPNPLARTPSTRYAHAWLLAQSDADTGRVDRALREARKQAADYVFPSRLHEYLVFTWAAEQPGNDPLAHHALGNLLYDFRRHEDAIAAWERAIEEDGQRATVLRNLGIAYWNGRHDGDRARAAYERAREIDPADARILFEFNQLRKRLNEPPAERLALLEAHRDLVLQRDDATVELTALYNLLDRPAEALAILTSRRFHPWEGGEGKVLRQYTAARLRLGEIALDAGEAETALDHFERALDVPANLGEAYHLHQAKADVNYWTARALHALGREDEAIRFFEASAAENRDFSEMAVAEHSPLSLFRGLALRELGRESEAVRFFEDLREYARTQANAPAGIDYFATSLPNLLVFDDDLQARHEARSLLLLALAEYGLGQHDDAAATLRRVLAINNSNLAAVQLGRRLPGFISPS